MKSLILIVAMTFAMPAVSHSQTTVMPGPRSEWGNWTRLNCHSVIEARVAVDSIHLLNDGPNQDGKFMIWYQLRNSDPTRTVSFSLSFGSDGAENTQRILGDSVKDFYRTTLAPGASTSKNWNYFTSDRSIVMEVGYFRTEGRGSTDYEGCGGAANAVDNFCRLKPVAGCPGMKKIEEERAKLANDPENGATLQNASYGNGPVKADVPCEDSAGKDGAEDIRQKIIQHLRENVQTITLEQPRGEQYTILSPSINASGETITIKFTQRWDSKDGFALKDGEEVSWWKQDLVQTLSFAALASTLRERPIGALERNAPYLSKTNVRWLAIDAAKDSQNYEAYKLNLVPGPPRGPVYGLPYDMGGGNANYKELGKLLAQLKAMPRANPGRVTVPCKETTAPVAAVQKSAPVASSSAAKSTSGSSSKRCKRELYEKIVANLQANLKPVKLIYDRLKTTEISNPRVSWSGKELSVGYTALVTQNNEWKKFDMSGTITFRFFAQSIGRSYDDGARDFDYFRNTNFRLIEFFGDCSRSNASGSLNFLEVGCDPLVYDVGPEEVNYKELVSLLNEALTAPDAPCP